MPLLSNEGTTVQQPPHAVVASVQPPLQLLWPLHNPSPQAFTALLLLAPRAVSKHVAGLLALTKTHTVCSTVVYTTAVALLAVTLSSLVQLLGIRRTMAAPQYDG